MRHVAPSKRAFKGGSILSVRVSTKPWEVPLFGRPTCAYCAKLSTHRIEAGLGERPYKEIGSVLKSMAGEKLVSFLPNSIAAAEELKWEEENVFSSFLEKTFVQRKTEWCDLPQNRPGAEFGTDPFASTDSQAWRTERCHVGIFEGQETERCRRGLARWGMSTKLFACFWVDGETL